jgi:hypothetical protein
MRHNKGQRMKMKNLVLASTFALSALTTNAYNIVDRAKLTDDRFKTLEMTRAPGHDFYINVVGWMSSEIMDLADDADKIGDIDNGDTSQDLAEMNTLLEKYYGKEQVLRANVGFGFPIFSFDAYGVKFEPNVRVDASMMAMMTPQKDNLSLTTIIAELDQIPQEVRSSLKGCLDNVAMVDGDNLLVKCNPTYISDIEVQQIKDAYGVDEIPYIASIATASQDVPAIDIYAKGEVKAGLWFDYTKDKHFFGTFGLYALGRMDIKKRADAVLLLGGGGNMDFADNTLVNAVFDYKFGYKNSNYSVAASVEEMKIAELSKSEDGEPLNFGDDALFRLHAQADYKPSVFKLSPYAGFHTRSGYGVGDAYYLGADWGMYFLEERLGLNIKTQIDKEHFTLGARAKFWIIHADVTGKFPITSEIDGTKVSGYYGANLRIFF